MTKRLLFLAVLSLVLLASPSVAVDVLTDDPAVLDGNFAWWMSANSQCLLVGVSGTESATIRCWDGSEWAQKPRLYPPSAEAGAQFGRRVKISDNNRLAGVCAPFDDQFGIDAGVLFLYEGPGDGTFPTFLQTLKGSDTNAGDRFCSSLDFDADGLGLSVGAVGADKAYTFTRSAFGQTFANEKKFVATGDDVGGLYGYSTCLDGSVASGTGVLYNGIPTAWNEAGGGDFWLGAVEVREQNRGGVNAWGVRNRITVPFTKYFGWALDCSREDNMVLVGAPLDITSGGTSGFSEDGLTKAEARQRVLAEMENFVPETSGQGRGTVYPVKLIGTGTAISFLPKLVSPTPQSDAEFGRVVAYDEATKTLLVTEPFSDVSGFENEGRGHAYHFNGTTFTRTRSFVPSLLNDFEEIGLSGAVGGGTIFIGSPFSNIAGPLDSGSTFVLNGPLFTDGFESGTTTAWSTTVP